MYWSYFGPQVYRRLAAEAGLAVEREGCIGHGYAATDARAERHPYLVLRKC